MLARFTVILLSVGIRGTSHHVLLGAGDGTGCIMRWGPLSYSSAHFNLKDDFQIGVAAGLALGGGPILLAYLGLFEIFLWKAIDWSP